MRRSSNFHFRQLGLKASDVLSIMKEVNEVNAKKPVLSISFSYNPLLADAGVMAILHALPQTIREIGLVGCNMTDISGEELLIKIKEFANLCMLCIEQNHFSDRMKEELKIFSQNNPQILVVF